MTNKASWSIRTLGACALIGTGLLALAHGASAAGPFAPRPMQMDIRDLSPLPMAPRASYPGSSSADADTQTAAAATSATTKKKKYSNQKAGRAAPQDVVTGKPAYAPSNLSSYPTSQSNAPGFLERFDLSYTGFFNGPSMGGEQGATYNPFARSKWPLYIYHTLDANYHFDRANLIGAELSAKSDLVSGVSTQPGFTPVDPTFTMYDPQFWYKRSGILNTDSFSTDAQFSIFPALTNYSNTVMGEYFSFAFDTTWNLKLRDRRWTSYFTTRIRPTYYAQLQMSDGYEREWMFLSTGYYVGYNLNPSWQVNVSGVFDCNFYADGVQLFNHGDGNDDRAQLELNYFAGRYARIGAYIQTIVTDPSVDKTFVGLDVTLNFLTARY